MPWNQNYRTNRTTSFYTNEISISQIFFFLFTLICDEAFHCRHFIDIYGRILTKNFNSFFQFILFDLPFSICVVGGKTVVES